MWMSRHLVDGPGPLSAPGLAVAVAIPACNEAASIEACIRALDVAAANAIGSTVTVVVLVNNSSDETAEIARRCRTFAARLSVFDITLPARHAHAGGARRKAFERAAAVLPGDGVLMTTDADSRVDPGWITANLCEIAAGADAVAGVVAFDEAARASLPLLPLRALEWRLAGLQARLASLVDPRPHDPWPNHIWAWGASLALTVSAYRHVGGLPSVPLAEDRALAEAIERCDLRLRHSHAPVVFTSARRDGRAPGGFADLLHSYAVDAATPCDAALEPTVVLLRRLRWRARLRRIAAADGLAGAAASAMRLGYDGRAHGAFGALWAAVEAQSPALARVRLHPATLAAEVALAERLVSRLERRATGPADTVLSVLVA